MGALVAFAVYYMVQRLLERQKLAKKTSTEALAAKASDFNLMMNKALRSRPIQKPKED